MVGAVTEKLEPVIGPGFCSPEGRCSPKPSAVQRVQQDSSVVSEANRVFSSISGIGLRYIPSCSGDSSVGFSGLWV